MGFFCDSGREHAWGHAVRVLSVSVLASDKWWRGLCHPGFFLDMEQGPKYHSNMQWVFKYMNSTTGVNDACIAGNG
eukprot:COSAG01_NODE_3548_length_5952_cov_7.082564_9_plen_76_part_00